MAGCGAVRPLAEQAIPAASTILLEDNGHLDDDGGRFVIAGIEPAVDERSADSTLFPLGWSVVTFRHQDFTGSAGTESARVEVGEGGVCG